ncbi:hypothetical protein PCA10_14040 [Metapseudomonas resinovorans NBRC 106553]|uniref:Uncharacterized protein n=1 Tax=Metapseudomonas resinovorans NBRC 106553 TaxID=1245471 RepID=S6ASR2_METRE|nr:hypothetical protein PCA10_14040 [Pseudomonas resinovorans NBRC 106553]
MDLKIAGTLFRALAITRVFRADIPTSLSKSEEHIERRVEPLSRGTGGAEVVSAAD